MTVKPLYDRVLVKRHDPVSKTKTGLFLPESSLSKSSYAQVVAVGHGHLSKDGKVTPLKVEPGMTVLLSEWSGDEVKIDGVDHLIVREKDILAVGA
ncbi:MAG: co-chaperone GroES [Myxococcota bacterium]